MTEIPEDISRIANDIMDNACLSEAYYTNGVVAAIREDIARAILAERQPCVHVPFL